MHVALSQPDYYLIRHRYEYKKVKTLMAIKRLSITTTVYK
jgi:hypothetical protein